MAHLKVDVVIVAGRATSLKADHLWRRHPQDSGDMRFDKYPSEPERGASFNKQLKEEPRPIGIKMQIRAHQGLEPLHSPTKCRPSRWTMRRRANGRLLEGPIAQRRPECARDVSASAGVEQSNVNLTAIVMGEVRQEREAVKKWEACVQGLDHCPRHGRVHVAGNPL